MQESRRILNSRTPEVAIPEVFLEKSVLQICSKFTLKSDVPDNFKKYKTKTIPKNIILSKSKYGLKTRY